MTNRDPLAQRLRAEADRHRRHPSPALRARLRAALEAAPAGDSEARPVVRQLALAAAILVALGLAFTWSGAAEPGSGGPRLPEPLLVGRWLPAQLGGAANAAVTERVATPLATELRAVVADAEQVGGNLFARVPTAVRRLLIPPALDSE